jgi:deazaflavin-dependent oxidoreductase (nitroreductase family)
MQAPPKITFMFRVAMAVQIFLLRRNWMGPAGNILMVITTTGRKSGKPHSTPIGYQPDGDAVIAFNLGGNSNWFKNVLRTPLVTLSIKGQQRAMHGELVTDPAEIERIVTLYQKAQPNIVERFWGLTAESAPEVRTAVKERVKFLRFRQA